MSRQDDVREVMRGLTGATTAAEADSRFLPLERCGVLHSSAGEPLTLPDAPSKMLNALCHVLREAGGIEATSHEVALGLLEALSRRPALCRGLLAAYLLDAEP